MSFLNPSPTHDLLSMRASLKQGGGTATIKRQKTRLQISETGATKLKEASEADFHGATTPIKKIVNANWPKISNQFSKSFRKVRDLQLKEKLHILLWSLKIYLPVIIHGNWILNL
uniref:Uncharacterized protein n=1 Tax=Brassica oleracea TaxID=3712 RepID=A0A3P6F585_BRAOL|nr:unnamed protein product [Brassica oleracea]